MKKLLVCLGLLLLVPGLALAQDPTTIVNDPAGPFVGYFVGYYANNVGPVPGSPDQVIRIINTGHTRHAAHQPGWRHLRRYLCVRQQPGDDRLLRRADYPERTGFGGSRRSVDRQPAHLGGSHRGRGQDHHPGRAARRLHPNCPDTRFRRC